MAAPKGNQFWKARTSYGREKLFNSPQILLNACNEYFKWVEDHPLYEHKVFHANGILTEAKIPKMRAMTISGLCLFLGITFETWSQYRKNNDYSEICEAVEQNIVEQKFTGAAADLLNPSIIARDLGLVDKIKKEVTGPNGGPLVNINADMPEKEAANLYAQMIKGGEDA